jgi:proteasome lid subunit RPN8/RPN11
MGRRADVDETLPPVVIPGRILNELYAHALKAQPEECCGLIIGDERERYRDLVTCRNDMTQKHQKDPVQYPRTGHDAFWMNEHDYQRAQAEAEARAQRVTAVYHSHVGSAVYLSEMDLAYAESPLFPFPDADHIVVSVSDEVVRGLGIFLRDGEGDVFRGRSVQPAVP